MLMASGLEIAGPVILFFALLFVGLPIAFALAFSGAIGLLATLGLPATLGMLETLPFRTTASYTLTTVAMFVLMAEFATQSGITQRLFEAANRFMGPLRGGLAMATIMASAAAPISSRPPAASLARNCLKADGAPLRWTTMSPSDCRSVLTAEYRARQGG